MRPWRGLGRGWLWRPLLAQLRDALREYAVAHGLRWIEDPSNEDARFDRNFLRQRVLPLLHERWPHADSAFARSAALVAEAADALAHRRRGAGCADRWRFPPASALRALPAQARARLLRRWIARSRPTAVAGGRRSPDRIGTVARGRGPHSALRLARCAHRAVARAAACDPARRCVAARLAARLGWGRADPPSRCEHAGAGRRAAVRRGRAGACARRWRAHRAAGPQALAPAKHVLQEWPAAVGTRARCRCCSPATARCWRPAATSSPPVRGVARPSWRAPCFSPSPACGGEVGFRAAQLRAHERQSACRPAGRTRVPKAGEGQ